MTDAEIQAAVVAFSNEIGKSAHISCWSDGKWLFSFLTKYTSAATPEECFAQAREIMDGWAAADAAETAKLATILGIAA